jgi:hypothetical protein
MPAQPLSTSRLHNQTLAFYQANASEIKLKNIHNQRVDDEAPESMTKLP